MTIKNDGGPAFPVMDEEEEHGQHYGMSLRDYFAAKVLPACYGDACREFASHGWPEGWRMGVALDAYVMADAMLAAREKS